MITESWWPFFWTADVGLVEVVLEDGEVVGVPLRTMDDWDIATDGEPAMVQRIHYFNLFWNGFPLSPRGPILTYSEWFREQTQC